MGYISLHWGSSVRLPISTKSLMPEFRLDRMAAEPMVCSTITISPSAMSSLGASYCAFENSEAVASMGSPGSG